MSNSLYISGASICCSDIAALQPFAVEASDVDKSFLPATLRRRAGLTTKMAVTAAVHACAQAQVNAEDLASVFASVGGEIQVTDALCRTLPDMDALLSPTQFHNSVHNAAAGYWAIAAHSPMPSTTVCACQASFVAGLMEAVAQLQVEARPVLLVAYDYPAPEPLAASVGAYPPFAVAMVLSPDATPRSTRLALQTVSGQPVQGMHCGELEGLRVSNPAACGLPLLRLLATGASGRVILPYVNGLQLAVDVENP